MGVSPKCSWMVDKASSEFFFLSPFIFFWRLWFWEMVRRFWELTSWLLKIFKILENPEGQISNGCVAKRQLTSWHCFFLVFFMSPFIFFSRLWIWEMVCRFWELTSWLLKIFKILENPECQILKGCVAKRLLTSWQGFFWVFFLSPFIFFSRDSDSWKWYVAFGSWQVDFGKFYRLWKIQRAKFQMGVSPKGSWQVDIAFSEFFSWVLLFFSRDSDFGKWYVAFGSWQVDFGKYSRFLKIQNVKF